MSSSLKGTALLVAFTTMALAARPAPAADPESDSVAALREDERRLTEKIEQDPTDAESYFRRGLLREELHELDKAIEDYDEAIRLGPKNPLAYIGRGSAWNDKREYEKAIADFDEAIRLDPKNSLARVGRGMTWRAKGDSEKRSPISTRRSGSTRRTKRPTLSEPIFGAPRAIGIKRSPISTRSSGSTRSIPWLT